MKLQKYIYQCEACQNKFEAPELLGEPYGEFLVRTEKGETSYLHAISDSVFKEVSVYLRDNPILSDMDRVSRARVLHEIFGIACDLSIGGYEYKIGGNPVCPRCHSNRMYSWEPIYPPEILDIDIPLVTHLNWNKLTNDEKQSRIENALKQILLK